MVKVGGAMVVVRSGNLRSNTTNQSIDLGFDGLDEGVAVVLW